MIEGKHRPMARFRIKQIAESQGIKNPTELMRITGIALSLAREIWRGVDLNLETNTLQKIAKALGVKVTDLIDDDDEAPATNKEASDA
jgi:DNA-binding Xre family transcriptional regulator